MKNVLNRLLDRENADKQQHESARQKEPQFKLGNGFYWEFDQIRNGFGGYKTVNAYLKKMDDPSFSRCIVDGNGEIQGFPGFKDYAWEKDLDYSFGDNRVRFVFWIYPFEEGKARVRWLIQPDGRYFADDDGFGAEHCVEIEMYSDLDENGRFAAPFIRK